ncbi:uncharacterized protein ARMOST_03902 [Armillaria ostoyae]|uniref:Uncharacterized protein n=1 Tax=Armillaria ostoyae TaxID=47428 RepID=A0A284QVW9_ARMOS|nr:uncharacterized protein ARMOST_03902 [Armillaria ostoyae]
MLENKLNNGAGQAGRTTSGDLHIPRSIVARENGPDQTALAKRSMSEHVSNAHQVQNESQTGIDCPSRPLIIRISNSFNKQSSDLAPAERIDRLRMTPAVSEIIKVFFGNMYSVFLGSANLLTAASVRATDFGSFVYPIVYPMGWSNAKMGIASVSKTV